MITVMRDLYTPRSVAGEMWIDDTFFCYTLEPPRGEVKPYCIPAGDYKARKYFSPGLQRVVLAVLNVPGFDDIEVHNGNYPRNTHGCTLVGTSYGPDFVGNSIVALESLLAKLPDEVEVDIRYIDAVEASA